MSKEKPENPLRDINWKNFPRRLLEITRDLRGGSYDEQSGVIHRHHALSLRNREGDAAECGERNTGFRLARTKK